MTNAPQPRKGDMAAEGHEKALAALTPPPSIAQLVIKQADELPELPHVWQLEHDVVLHLTDRDERQSRPWLALRHGGFHVASLQMPTEESDAQRWAREAADAIAPWAPLISMDAMEHRLAEAQRAARWAAQELHELTRGDVEKPGYVEAIFHLIREAAHQVLIPPAVMNALAERADASDLVTVTLPERIRRYGALAETIVHRAEAVRAEQWDLANPEASWGPDLALVPPAPLPPPPYGWTLARPDIPATTGGLRTRVPQPDQTLAVHVIEQTLQIISETNDPSHALRWALLSGYPLQDSHRHSTTHVPLTPDEAVLATTAQNRLLRPGRRRLPDMKRC